MRRGGCKNLREVYHHDKCFMHIPHDLPQSEAGMEFGTFVIMSRRKLSNLVAFMKACSSKGRLSQMVCINTARDKHQAFRSLLTAPSSTSQYPMSCFLSLSNEKAFFHLPREMDNAKLLGVKTLYPSAGVDRGEIPATTVPKAHYANL